MNTQLFLLIHLITAWAGFAGEPLIVAHRGASREAPENTLPAFRLAWEQGADAVEMDLRLTRDGVIVCFHDESTLALTGKDLLIKETTFAELARLDVGQQKGPAFIGTRIPRLSEALETVPPHGMVYLELKTGPEILPALLQDVKRSGLDTDQIRFISFNQQVLATLKEMSPDHKTLWLSKIRHTRSGRTVPGRDTILHTLNAIQADGFSASRKLRDRFLIRSLQKRGFEFHVWTVNDPETAQWFRKAGALSITTKNPALLKQHLQ